MSKRANGEGTVRQRPDGRWEGRYKDPFTGKQKSIYGKTQKEVISKLRITLYENDAGNFVADNSLTLNEWFEIYMEQYKSGVVKPQTENLMRSRYYNHVKPIIGNKELSAIVESDIRAVLQKLKEKYLSISTVKIITKELSALLNKAQSKGFIKEIPTKDIVIPQKYFKEPVKKRELTNEEISWFFKGLAEYKPSDVLYFEILYYTGARRGEIASLRWCDISEDFSIIHINSTYIEYSDVQTKKYVKKVGTTKTETSVRDIPLPECICEELKKKKENAKLIASQFNRDFSNENYIFINASDNTILRTGHYTNIVNATIRFLEKNYNVNLQHFSMHYFRHTFTSQALRKNVSMETLKQILGHSSYAMIDKIYAHCSIDDKSKAINQMFQ